MNDLTQAQINLMAADAEDWDYLAKQLPTLEELRSTPNRSARRSKKHATDVNQAGKRVAMVVDFAKRLNACRKSAQQIERIEYSKIARAVKRAITNT